MSELTNVVVSGTGIISSTASSIQWSAPTVTFSGPEGSTWTVSSIDISRSNEMLVNGSYCQPVQNYAWGGFDFLLYSIGLLVMVFAVYVACEAYKEYYKQPLAKSVTKGRK